MKTPKLVETLHLILRKPRMDDAPAIFAGWTQDTEVTRYLTWRPHQRLEQTEEFIRGCLSAWEGETRFPYVITCKENDTPIGMIDPRIESHQVGIGYVMNKAYQRNGYMTEATCAIIDWTFQQPSIYRVYATTDVENIASRRVMEKAGMQCEGVLRKYVIHPNISDVPRDCYMYAIVK